MRAALAIRSRRLGAVVALAALSLVSLVSLVVWFKLFFVDQHSSATPITNRIPTPDSRALEHETPSSSSNLERMAAAASNSTLGFSRILAIHMKHRWDKWDAAMIQAYTSGLDITYYEAVDGKVDIEDAGHIGLPPMHGRQDMGPGEIACGRSHANIWADLVRTRGPPVMIFESDAAWDVNIRGVMGTANKNFLDYLTDIHSEPGNTPLSVREEVAWPAPRGVDYDPDDPWRSDHWDVITLGYCSGIQNFYDDKEHPKRHYVDKFNMPSSNPFWPSNRMLFRSTGWACTTAYAVSHRGAAKMLIRHALNLDQPIDLILEGMINEGLLVSYAIHPTPVVQWHYHDNIGMKVGGSSDLFRIDKAGQDQDPAWNDTSAWEEVWKLKSPWVWAEKFGGKKFRFLSPALGGAWQTIFGAGAQFEMPVL